MNSQTVVKLISTVEVIDFVPLYKIVLYSLGG